MGAAGQSEDEYYREIRQKLVSVLVRKGGLQQHQAEDIGQRTILLAYERKPVEQPGELLFWCIRTATNLAHEARRHNARHAQWDEESWSRKADPSQSPDEAKQAAVEEIEYALSALDEEQRLMMRLVLEERSSDEIAQQLGIGVPAYFMRLSRCRRQMKRLILELRNKGQEPGRI